MQYLNFDRIHDDMYVHVCTLFSHCQLEVYHTDSILEEHLTVRDVIYIYSWQKVSAYTYLDSGCRLSHRQSLLHGLL